MQSWFVNYKRVKRCTKGNDRCHLSGAASAVWLYHQRGNVTFWCLHKRSISISQKCNSFHPSLSRGIDCPKNIQWFSFFSFSKLTKQQEKKKRSRKASSLIFCPFPTSLLVYFLVEILLECKVNRLRYSEGLGLARRCQISRWAQRVDSSDTAMAAVQERGSARCFKVAGWLLFMNKTLARNLDQHTHTRNIQHQYNGSLYFFRLINGRFKAFSVTFLLEEPGVTVSFKAHLVQTSQNHPVNFTYMLREAWKIEDSDL